MDPVIIQAAITGSMTTLNANRNLPVSIEQNVAAAVEACEAGAAVIHVHAREEDATPTQRLERFAPIVQGIRTAGCNVILNLSTGSAGGRASGAERYACIELGPELASFDCGSTNFGDWVFQDSLPFLREMARSFREHGVKPELECFDTSHITTALLLRDEGLLDEPLHFQFVLGVSGGAPGTPEQALHMRSMVPAGSTWSICGVGRAQLPMNLLSLLSDGHIRTGLEDNVYYSRGRLAASNAELVRRVVRIAEEIGRPVATPDEARTLLSLPIRPRSDMPERR